MPSAVAGQSLLTPRWVQYSGNPLQFLDGTGNFSTAGGGGGETSLGAGSLSSSTITLATGIVSTFAYIEVQFVNYAFNTAARSLLVQPNNDSTATNYIYSNTSTNILGSTASLGANAAIATAGDTALCVVTIWNYAGARPHFLSYNRDASETPGTPAGIGANGLYMAGPITSIVGKINGSGTFTAGSWTAKGFS